MRSTTLSTLECGALVAACALFAGCQGALAPPDDDASPRAWFVPIERVRRAAVDKVDLLIVVDNSPSMADKQRELARRVPNLIAGLLASSPGALGTRRLRVQDLHVAVITASLGSFGTSVCAPQSGRHHDDHGQLMPRADFAEKAGFKVDELGQQSPDVAPCPGGVVQASALTWVSNKRRDPLATYEGVAATTTLQTAASCLVASVRDDGCGYPSQLESVYRFLIDPAPYDKAEVKCTRGSSGDDCGNNLIELTPMGKAKDPAERWGKQILEQRKAFLRRDSLLLVLLSSDKNDASLMPDRRNWIPWAFAPGTMKHGFEGCQTVPEDFEPATSADYDTLFTKYDCWSCFLQDARHPDLDGSCKVGWGAKDPDSLKTRPFQQTRRFGYNFYWSRDRYVRGFTEPSVVGSDGKLGANPIYEGGFRSKDMVVVAGILGVPKNLVQGEAGKPKELTADDWDKIVGPDYDSPGAAERMKVRDPHMVESTAPRTELGIKHFAGSRDIDPINGGDRDIPDGDDLQYACIAPRTTSEDGQDCEKNADRNPLCDGPKRQPYFKAYPGLRELRVLRDVTKKGAVGLVSSICSDSYLPAMRGIVDKVRAAIDVSNVSCFDGDLEPNAKGAVSCALLHVLETRGDGPFTLPDGRVVTSCRDLGTGYCTPGAAPCRVPKSGDPPVSSRAAASQITGVRLGVTLADGSDSSDRVNAQVDEGGNIYLRGPRDRDRTKHLVCEVKQLAAGCRSDPPYMLASPTDGGWCYSTDPTVVGSECVRRGSRGTIRYLGVVTPPDARNVLISCQ